MTELLAAFGLAAATGLNAYLPLLIVGALARYTDLITLKSPWSALTHPVVLVVLVVLLIIEMTVDKIPAVDTINDVIQTFIRPAAGAILFAASSNVISDMSPVLAMVCGLLVAGEFTPPRPRSGLRLRPPWLAWETRWSARLKIPSQG